MGEEEKKAELENPQALVHQVHHPLEVHQVHQVHHPLEVHLEALEVPHPHLEDLLDLLEEKGQEVTATEHQQIQNKQLPQMQQQLREVHQQQREQTSKVWQRFQVQTIPQFIHQIH